MAVDTDMSGYMGLMSELEQKCVSYIMGVRSHVP